MTEGIFADIKMIKFGATPDEIYSFLKEAIAELDKANNRSPKAVEIADKAIDEYLTNTVVNEEVKRLLKHTYEDAKERVEKNIYHAKELANDIAWWYNGDVESAELWVFCEINNIVAIVATVKMEIEFLEHIIDNVNKMMDEAKAKSEELGVEYIEGYTCVAGVSVPVQKPYPEVKNKYDL